MHDLGPEDLEEWLGEAAKSAEPPADACDCHVQVFGPTDRYPLAGKQADGWEPGDSTPEHYRKVQAALGFSRAVLVQPMEYGHDHACLIDAVEALFGDPGGERRGCVCGVAMPGADVEDAELEDLTAAGIRAARFVMGPDGSGLDWDSADRLAWRVHDLGWTISLRMEGSDLHEVEQRLRDWPGWVAFEAIGNFRRTKVLNQRGFKALTRLIDRDRAWVKLAAPYESARRGRPDDPEVAAIARALADWAPERMVWGSGWPHASVPEDPPDDRVLLKLLADWVPEETRRHRILRDNPAELHGFEETDVAAVSEPGEPPAG